MAHYPKYQMVIDYIIDKINKKELVSGDKIPSENQFSEMLDVSNITVRRAMSDLVNSGIIYRVKGKGSFVSTRSIQEKKKSNRLVAFLFSEGLNGNAYMQFISYMQKYFLKHSYSLISESIDDNMQNELSIIQKLIDKHVEGFIIYSKNPENSIPSFKALEDNNIPFVLIDRYTPLFPTNYIGSNNHDGSLSAVRHLIALQHIGIAFIAHQFYLSSERERYNGYLDGLISAQLPFNQEYCFTEESTNYEQLITHIKDGSITAIVAVNDYCAINVMNYITQAGLHIPNDVLLIGFDDSDIIKQTMIPLTTVKQFFNEIGYSAAKLLVESINQNRHDYNHKEVGTKLIVRESTQAK